MPPLNTVAVALPVAELKQLAAAFTATALMVAGWVMVVVVDDLHPFKSVTVTV